MNIAIAGFFNVAGWLIFGVFAATEHKHWEFAVASLSSFIFAIFATFDRRLS